MYNYHKPPPLPSEKERIQKGKQIGRFAIDILPNENNLKIYTYWGGFNPSFFERFKNDYILNTLRNIYSTLKPDEFSKKPHFKEFFNDKSDKTIIHKITPKKKYSKGTKFIAYLQLEIILKPYDSKKGELFFKYRNYGFPDNIPESFKDSDLYPLLKELNDFLKNNKYLL